MGEAHRGQVSDALVWPRTTSRGVPANLVVAQAPWWDGFESHLLRSDRSTSERQEREYVCGRCRRPVHDRWTPQRWIRLPVRDPDQITDEHLVTRSYACSAGCLAQLAAEWAARAG